jgi:hypothetical protein
VDTFRTLCLAPSLEARALFNQLARQASVAAVAAGPHPSVRQVAAAEQDNDTSDLRAVPARDDPPLGSCVEHADGMHTLRQRKGASLPGSAIVARAEPTVVGYQQRSPCRRGWSNPR